MTIVYDWWWHMTVAVACSGEFDFPCQTMPSEQMYRLTSTYLSFLQMAQYLLASHVETDIEDFEDVLYEQSLLAEPRG